MERVEAARSLYACGGDAVPCLCEALADRCIPVRLAAAETLGRIGDPSAIPALTQALNACFIGGSPRRQLASSAGIGFLGCLLIVLFPLGFLQQLFQSGMEALFRMGEPPPYKTTEPSRAPVYARALVEIAERNPSTELRALLPELRAASLDLLQLDREARQASRETASRIVQLTDRLKTLPTPASAPAPEVSALPLPAAPSARGGPFPLAAAAPHRSPEGGGSGSGSESPCS